MKWAAVRLTRIAALGPLLHLGVLLLLRRLDVDASYGASRLVAVVVLTDQDAVVAVLLRALERMLSAKVVVFLFEVTLILETFKPRSNILQIKQLQGAIPQLRRLEVRLLYVHVPTAHSCEGLVGHLFRVQLGDTLRAAVIDQLGLIVKFMPLDIERGTEIAFA